MELSWEPFQAPLPGGQMWSARTRLMSYVISHDRACIPDDVFYNRFAVSMRMLGSTTKHLGAFDTLEEAKAAAELSRKGASA